MARTTAIRWVMAAAGLAAAPGAARAAAPLEFEVDDVTIVGSTPDRYCAPTGGNKIVADVVAQTDPQNRTLVMLVRCDRRDKPEGMRYDYYLVKTPRGAVPEMTRTEFIAMVTKELALPQYRDAKAPLEDIADDVSKTLGTKIDLSGEVRPRGVDDVCIYLGGKAQVTSASASYSLAVGGCGTVVGGKLVYIYSYDDSTQADSVAVLIRRSRALADTLKSAGRPNRLIVTQP